MRLPLIALVPITLAAATASAAPTSSDEQAIRAADQRWVKLIAAKDLKGISGFYAPDASFMAPNQPVARGSQAITEAWRGLLAQPGMSLSFAPEEIQVAKGGDMAFDRGTYRLVTKGKSGPSEDRGKYLVVWRKVGGQWKAAADMLNSDLPAK